MKKRNNLYPIVHIPMFQIGGGKGAPEYLDPAKFKPMIEPKKSNPDEMRFSDWYRAQLKAGKAGDIVTYRGKKILLDPRDFPGYKAPSGQEKQVSNTASSRSNTPVKAPVPANQVQNTIAVNTPTKKNKSILDYGTERNKDPYFFADESDPSWIKAVDWPFRTLRNTGASVARLLTGNSENTTDVIKGAAAFLPLGYRATKGALNLIEQLKPSDLKSAPEYISNKTKSKFQRGLGSPQMNPRDRSIEKQMMDELSDKVSNPNPYRLYQQGGPFIPMFDDSEYIDEDYLYNDFENEDFMKEGGIHINPANRGKFTASASAAGMGVQEFARHVLTNPENYSTTQRKRANFARNAAKWKHQAGGYIFKQLKG